MNKSYLPAEWHRQSLIQLTWPHEDTDWAPILDEVEACFLNIACEVLKRQNLLVVAPHPDAVREKIIAHGGNADRLTAVRIATNDTWARDHGFITLLDADGTPQLLDFRFNGWGLKFAANLDNQINRGLYFGCRVLNGAYANHGDFVLEGGSIESDGKGTLLTTSLCLLSPNRNEKPQEQLEDYLKKIFHLERVLWLGHGYLRGDDTDSHIDTLARFCPDDTIAYVKCTDREDEHYTELARMEKELKAFRTLDGRPYRLLPLPMADAICDENGDRLPATYANFLVLNGAVLYPTYHHPENDRHAGEVLTEAFPSREVVGIDCRALIRQHGSLHCVTMQYPEGVHLKLNDSPQRSE